MHGTKKVLGTYTPEEAAQVYARVIYRLGQLKYKHDKKGSVPLQVGWTNNIQMQDHLHSQKRLQTKKKMKEQIDVKRANIHHESEIFVFSEAIS